MSRAMKRMLHALLKLLLVLMAVSHGTANFCDITETKTLVQCYGALGQSVFMYPFNTRFDLKVSFQGKEFFRYKHKTGLVDKACQSRCQFMTNGIIRLDNLMKSDSGIYAIEEWDNEGKHRQNMTIYLTIQDPVSPPALSQLCLSHGEIRVNCSSTGPDPQYSWALDNSPLDGGVAFLSNETQTVILRRNVSGSITCTASNRVSREHTTQELQKCPDPVSPPALSQLCLSHGEIRVSCLSTGDDPQYSWALDNRTLDGGVAFLSNETQTVTLRRNVSGSITCTASNRVSREHTTQELQKCPGSSGSIVLFAVLGVCLSLMVLLLGTCYLYKKQKQTKTSQRSAGDRCEDPQELVYSQVQVVKKKQRPKKQEQEQEQEPQVVYGEVKVSDASKAVRPSPNEQTDTIYSGIRT